MAYVYCNYKDRTNQTTLNLLLSIIKQQILQYQDMPQAVADLYAERGNGQFNPSMKDAQVILEQNFKLFRKTFIFIDALDEHLIEDVGSCSHVSLIDTICALIHPAGGERSCKLFLTSRKIPAIAEKLKKAMRIDINATAGDIRMYTLARIQDDCQFRFADSVNRDPVLKEKIARAVVNKAHGM